MSYAYWNKQEPTEQIGVPMSNQEVAPAFSMLQFMLTNKPFLLLLLTIGAELLLPILIWKTPIPGSARWLGDIGIVVILVWTVGQMLLQDRIPTAALFLVGFTLISSTVAAFEGQAATATAWGWWMMFKYHVVAIFVYLQREWPIDLAKWFYQLLILVLSVQVVIQIGQYLTGEPTGDNLAGTFGTHGVSPLLNFLLIVTGLAYGYWLVDGNWRRLGYVLFLGSLSSTLGAMRLYYICMPLLGVIAMLIHLIKGGRLQSLLMYIFLFSAVIPLFVFAYNTTVAAPRGQKTLQELLGENVALEYLNNARYNPEDGKYDLGRNFSAIYGWQSIQRDPITLLFGYGVGSRSNSSSLGIVGAALAESDYGVVSGTSLLVLIQELGVGGLALFCLVWVWILAILWRCTQMVSAPYLQIVAYGLILYTCGWPIWLWHSGAWRFPVSMLLYWGLVGYVIQIYYHHRKADSVAFQFANGDL